VDEKDIQTEGFQVNPLYSWVNNTSKLTGYQVSNTVTVSVRKIDDTGKILESSVLNQANAINGLYFKIADDSKVYQEALKQAVRNAEVKAKTMIGTLENKKLTVAAIRENSTNAPQPVEYMEMAKRLNDTSAPISKGTVEIRASVSVDFQFQ